MLELTQRNIAPLKRRLHWSDISLPGEWAWVETLEFDFLMLICPFCGFEAPVPHTNKVVSGTPLTLEEQLTCGNCGQSFHVFNDKAIKSGRQISATENS